MQCGAILRAATKQSILRLSAVRAIRAGHGETLLHPRSLSDDTAASQPPRDWSRRLVAEHQAYGRRSDLAGVRQEGRNARTPINSMPGVDASRSTSGRSGEAGARSAFPPSRCFPTSITSARRRRTRGGNPDNLVCRAVRRSRTPCRHRRHLRCGARPFTARPGRPRARWLRPERRDLWR